MFTDIVGYTALMAESEERGLLPTWNEAGLAFNLTNAFRRFRSFGDFWEGAKPGYNPEFVEWVEEQRAKAA